MFVSSKLLLVAVLLSVFQIGNFSRCLREFGCLLMIGDRTIILDQATFASQGTFDNVWRYFWLSKLGEGVLLAFSR